MIGTYDLPPATVGVAATGFAAGAVVGPPVEACPANGIPPRTNPATRKTATSPIPTALNVAPVTRCMGLANELPYLKFTSSSYYTALPVLGRSAQSLSRNRSVDSSLRGSDDRLGTFARSRVDAGAEQTENQTRFLGIGSAGSTCDASR